MKINNNIPVIIDTDPGHDDALAIMLLAKSGIVDIKAVTAVAGNSTIQNVTNNARYILNLVGSSAPIFSGAEKPLQRDLITAVVHGKGGLEGAQIKKKEKLTANAVEEIISIVRNNPHEISVLIIGPETNIASAFLQDPELPSLIKQLVIMGGAIGVPGNKNRVAEFNIFVDPEAADIVFRSDVKKVLVPLDVCNEVILNLSDFERLRGALLYEPIKDMMEKYVEGVFAGEQVRGAPMYDPLAAYFLLNPDSYTTESMDVQIEVTGTLTRGMTIAEKRVWGDAKPNVQVVTAVNKAAFIGDMVKILKK